jgi:hypothetical protein
MRKLIGCGEIPTDPFPVLASVSLLISSRISSKFVNFLPGRCRNSPHSSGSEEREGGPFFDGEDAEETDASVLLSEAIPPTSPFALGLLMSCRMRGRRVTIPDP